MLIFEKYVACSEAILIIAVQLLQHHVGLTPPPNSLVLLHVHDLGEHICLVQEPSLLHFARILSRQTAERHLNRKSPLLSGIGWCWEDQANAWPDKHLPSLFL